MELFSPVFRDYYDPLKAGSIDGTDEYPHDKAISRAMVAKYKPNKYVKGDPECTLFIGRLNHQTTEESIKRNFKQFGKINFVRLVRDIVTGSSKCYAFVEFTEPFEARYAARNGYKMIVDDHEVLVELEKERLCKGWIPRRLGGGLGGKRESGQLRFGGRDRPFRRPILRPDFDKDNIKDNSGKYNTNQDHFADRRRKRSRSLSREQFRSRSRERSRNRERSRSRESSSSRKRSRRREKHRKRER